MTDFSLYSRMRTHGTLAETPTDVPDARFALPSTINWMRALAILVDDLAPDFGAARRFYANVQRRAVSDREVNSICEQLLFALNQIASLRAIVSVPNKADVARIGIVAWYYGIYGAASAMVAAADGSFPDTHAGTAMQWARYFPMNRLAMAPFADRLSNLSDATIEAELAPMRARGKHSLTVVPTAPAQAWGCCTEYLSGTAGWEQWNIREQVKGTREFKDLGTDSFRTAAAKKLRDARYEKRGIAFLHEASRYRGKANYRDAIYLAYGTPHPDEASFMRCLEVDGFTITDGTLRRILPAEAELPQAESEIMRLLNAHGFSTPRGHLKQALDAHGRGDWAAANSQLRTFLEGLLDEIAEKIDPAAKGITSGHSRRAHLANVKPPFLERTLNEWGDNGIGFINGLMARLHPQGSHPGLSDEADSTFRLHVVLVTARLLLVRFQARKQR